MSNKVLIAVHGMGQHTAETFGACIRNSIDSAVALYPSLEGKTADDLIDIVPVIYNDIFDEYRATKIREPIFARRGYQDSFQ